MGLADQRGVDNNEPETLTLREAAQRYQVSVATLKRELYYGNLPAEKEPKAEPEMAGASAGP